MLDVYGVDHALPLGGVVSDFPFTEVESRRHFSYLFGTFRDSFSYKIKICSLKLPRDPFRSTRLSQLTGRCSTAGNDNYAPSGLIMSTFLIRSDTSQLSSRGWVDTGPDLIHILNCGNAENRTRDLRISTQTRWCRTNASFSHSRQNIIASLKSTIRRYKQADLMCGVWERWSASL